MPKQANKRPPFPKILIANRGEIACRVIRTCHYMGINTVAVYSEADASALHVQQADEAILLGPSPPAESYLNISAVIRAAKETGAQAVHPGYGFLSENPSFAAACREADIVFIGPTPGVMELMGDKAQARRLAGEAGLPLLPGTEADLTDQEALDWSIDTGFPIMVKAAHGGGGIGIRMVHKPEELPEALARARSLAESAFGSSQVYLEKYLSEPSHVEVQVLADLHGNAVHLFERDCSVQRRNQKVVEETPTVKLKKSGRRAMHDAALALVSHINYTNAGTVEFLIDQEGHFYFLEINMRIQVEHPVTEMVTGLDLIEHQIRIAAGEPLSLSQKTVRLKGHAIEARIYPEAPGTFMPTIGRVDTVREPKSPNVRVDSALIPGYEVTSYYDSLMAKVTAWGKSRKKAITTLNKALEDFQIAGVTHNIPLIQQVLANEEFQKGTFNTLLLTHMFAQNTSELSQDTDQETVAAITVALGSLFGNVANNHASQWKTYGRAAQMTTRPSRGGYW